MTSSDNQLLENAGRVLPVDWFHHYHVLLVFQRAVASVPCTSFARLFGWIML
jgi:hypothetical protein